MTKIITFGCRLNTYESEVMRKHAEAAGLKDAVIVNTCAVTAEAERQARQAIRKIRREKPGAKIIVTGCAAHIEPEKFRTMPEVDYVFGNEAKKQAETFFALNSRKPARRGEQDTANLVTRFEGKSRAFVEVQNGCNHGCTYCIIPRGRGNSRSVPPALIDAQVRLLVQNGYNEIVFTGVDITAYGEDSEDKTTLGEMIRYVLDANPELKRLRLSSLDPVEVDEDVWDLIAHEPRLMPHLHLSLQAGDDTVLKRMKRRHRAADVVNFCERARKLRPDVVFGADIIAGFPTETDAMFENTLRLVEETGLTWLHVFPYSARKGTPAARMPQVQIEIRKERAARLREAGKRAVQRHLDSLIGKTFEVLVEKPDLGRSPAFAEVALLSPAVVGSVVAVECVARDGQKAVAKLVEQER